MEEGFNGDPSRINYLDRASERGLSTFDVTLNNTTSLIWEVPYGRGRRRGGNISGLADAVLGGWRTTFINHARSGVPINVYYSPSSQGAVCGACRTRPNITGPIVNDAKDPNNFFNNDNIVIPPVTAPFGNLSRNFVRTHGFAQLDLALHKEFQLPRENARLEIRAEYFNLLNRTNFLGPEPDASDGDFGTITGTFPARQIQFGLKLYL
jgi:hypothetical protein